MNEIKAFAEKFSSIQRGELIFLYDNDYITLEKSISNYLLRLDYDKRKSIGEVLENLSSFCRTTLYILFNSYKFLGVEIRNSLLYINAGLD